MPLTRSLTALRLLGPLTLTLLAAGSAQAVRPFVTEDAGVLDRGSCEFEASYGVARQRGSANQRRWWLQPVCGVGARTQIALGTGAVHGQGVRTQGVALLGKTWLTTPTDDGPNLAIAYGVSTSKESGDRWRHDAKTLNLAGSLRSGASTWSANLGWSRDVIGRSSGTTWALAWERPVVERLDAGIEVFGDDHEAPWLNVGLRWTVREGVWLDAAYASQTDAARARALNVGLRLGW
jgi:hypothetical protein